MNLTKAAIVFFLALITLFGCRNANDTKPNGWYYTPDGKEISGKPILTIKDIETVQLDSAFMGSEKGYVYEITGRFYPEASREFAEYTEKNVGKMIGFYFDGEILAAPMINMKIEGERFSIISLPSFKDKEKVMVVLNTIEMGMESKK